MKMAYILLGIFLLTMTFRQAHSRELTYKEKLVTASLKRTKEVKDFMQTAVNPNDLPFSDYLRYQVMKKGCDPLDLALLKIKEADEELPDQSDKITGLYLMCSESSLGLTQFYIQQR